MILDQLARIQFPGPPRHVNRLCEAQFCGNRTKEDKPFCLDHIECNSYAAKVAAELAQQEAEREQILAGDLSKKAIAETFLCQEIMLYLSWRGPATAERLVRELNVKSHTITFQTKSGPRTRLFDPISLVLQCGQALKTAGKVRLAKNKRHSDVLVPVKKAIGDDK